MADVYQHHFNNLTQWLADLKECCPEIDIDQVKFKDGNEAWEILFYLQYGIFTELIERFGIRFVLCIKEAYKSTEDYELISNINRSIEIVNKKTGSKYPVELSELNDENEVHFSFLQHG